MKPEHKQAIIRQCLAGSPSARFALVGLVKRTINRVSYEGIKNQTEVDQLLELADVCSEVVEIDLEHQLRDLVIFVD